GWFLFLQPQSAACLPACEVAGLRWADESWRSVVLPMSVSRRLRLCGTPPLECPESVEASPAVNEKNYPNHNCGSAHRYGYRGLPYTDHNYGAPPPPTPPASPLSQTIIPRMELNGVARGPASRYHDNATNGGQEENSADSDSSSEEDGAVASWCHCSLTQDGFLIKCESCRGLDRRKGLYGQRRKPENVSVGESSATESGDEEVSPATVSYTATQHTPTSITLTVNRVKRNKSKKRKKSTEKARGVPKAKKIKAFREGSRKSMRMKNSTTEASAVDETTAEGWESRIRQWTDQYEEATANQYSADIQTLLQLHRAVTAEGVVSETTSPAQVNASADTMDTINRTELACNNTVLGSQMQLQLARVTRMQNHRKILRAARDLEPDTLIIEYRGKVMLKQQFEVNGHFFKKPYPFVLFYSKFNEVEMCVDARTFGNDARFIRSNYKVDCACHKGNQQNCPVQKHNLNPRETLLCPGTGLLPPPSQLPGHTGAETRRRKARRREMEGPGGMSDDSNQPPEESGEVRETLQGNASLGNSDIEEGLLKQEEGEEGELEENGVLISSRQKRTSTTGGIDQAKHESLESEEWSRGNPTGGIQAGVGISTRRATYATEPSSAADADKAQASAAPLPEPLAPPKPPPARSSKPRPKSRISRYRSSSSQRARRQRQALAQQQAALEQGASAEVQESPLRASGSELGLVDGALGAGQVLDGEGLSALNKGILRSLPKTKKYLVTEWLNDKVLDKVAQQEVPTVERQLRITTDPTVLATTLNMLPGLAASPLICTAPKHYVRFGSPFNPERRRRPVSVDASYGSFKKRWIQQAQDESGLCSGGLEDGTESTSSHQSNSSSSTPNPFKAELAAPPKKRWSIYGPEAAPPLPGSEEHSLLLRPLLPITPPLPSDHPVLSPASYAGAAMLGRYGDEEHRLPGSISPEPCLRPDFDAQRCALQFPDLSLSSGLESPVPAMSDDFTLLSATGPHPPDTQGPLTPLAPGTPSESAQQAREQSFRTEFNLIYTCSPLNANLGNPAPAAPTDRRLSQSEGSYSPAESFYSAYRKRKQGSSKDPEHGGSSLGTPTRLGSPGGPRSLHLQPPASPHSSFSSPPQMEEVSPPDNHHHTTVSHAVGPPKQQQPRDQEGTSDWMVPTTVERLREGQGVLERVLRGSLKMDRMLKRTDGSTADKDPVYTHQVQPPLSESHQQTADSPAFLQQSASSPFHGSYSPSAPPPSGQGFYPRLSSHPALSQDHSQQHPQQPLNSPSSFSNQTISADSALCGASRPPGGALHQPSSSSSMDGSHVYSAGSQLKASLLNSGLSGSPTPGSRAHGNPKTDLGASAAGNHASRLSQQLASRSLKPGSPGQTVLQAGSRLLAANASQHYPQRGAPLSQFQHPPIQGSGVRTQSGSF
ncbi:unnamed protein product, partial [Coregonus sp. 'balchen']